MTKGVMRYSETAVETLIQTIRGQRVILDTDLAKIYGVPTKRLNEQVRRNAERFPEDFLFRISPQELTDLRSHFAPLNGVNMRSQNVTASNWSQIATSSRKHRGITYRPYAFTEHGAIMAANVLNSPQAVQMSVFVVRAFIRMRQMLSVPHELAPKLAELEKKLTARLDGHEVAITEVLQQIMLLLNPPPEPEPPAKQIGFHVREKSATYRMRKSSQ